LGARVTGVPDPVYRAHVAPRLLAPAAELVLDALDPFAKGERILEADAGVGLLSRVLGRRVQDAEAELWVFDSKPSLVGPLRHLPGVRVAAAGAVGDLPVPDAAVETLVINGFNAARHPLARALGDARRALQPGGKLVFSCFIAGTFQELLDLLLEAIETRGEGDLCRRLSDARAAMADAGLLRDLLRKAGFEIEKYGEEERAVFPRGALVQDPLFTVFAPTIWLGEVPPLPWDAVADAVRAYFSDSTFSVRVRTGLVCARAV
jgi:SAM-dependent methyltransferase